MRTASLLLLSLLAACGKRELSPEEPRSATYLVQHHAATELAPILEEVLNFSCTGCRRKWPPPAAPVEKPAPLHVHADDARNTLLFRGTEHQLQAALDMSRRIDVPPSQERGTSK
ncbi:MAG TPA: secretin N-terminal domain-containing protein [Planctomycetota bacterium]